METAKPVVLVAEDSAVDLFIIKRALAGGCANCILHFVRDGQEAVDYLEGASPFGDRQKFPLPDMVLTDLRMPRLDGFEVLAWIRSHPQLAKLPVVMLTSSSIEEDRDKAATMGVAAYLIKDIFVENPAALAEAVRKQLPAQEA